MIDIVSTSFDFLSVIVNVFVNSLLYVALSLSLSVYTTVKFCGVLLFVSNPAGIISSVRGVGVPAPAILWFTMYFTLLSLNNCASVSPHSPVIELGFIAIPVTSSFCFIFT